MQIEPFYTLKYGRCFTFTATTPSSTFTEIGGYKFQFHHTDTVKMRNFYGISLAGYHIYIHGPNQILRGKRYGFDKMRLYSFLLAEDEETLRYMEYLYLEAGEDLRVKLRLQQLNKINSVDYQCEESADYSRTKVSETLFKVYIPICSICLYDKRNKLLQKTSVLTVVKLCLIS